jgi:hypothetical protein
MGRPLNDRFFGNRNVGSLSTTTDNGIGGEGLAAYTLGALGSVLVNSSGTNVQPTLVIPAPTLPGGVPATATVVWEVESVTVTSTGTNYTDTLPTAVTFTGLAGGVVGTLTAVGPGGNKGAVTINFSGGGANRGSFTTIPRAAATYEVCSAINVSGGGDNAQANIKFRVKSITTVEKGSGYASVPTLSWANTTAQGTMPAAPTVALTTDSGLQNPSQNPSTYQANAIVIHANTTDAGTKIGDIQKQVGSRRYSVKTADGLGRVKLVASGSPAVGEAYIVATDSTSHTYYVTKLTARRATLVPFGSAGHEFPLVADGKGGTEPVSAGWVFSGATVNKTVVIENA